jgi:hypothetical protein
MNDEIEFDLRHERSRWLAYFDLLGTAELSRKPDLSAVVMAYRTALRTIRCLGSKVRHLHHVHFSDSFLVYSENDEASNFVEIDYISQWFAFFLLVHKVPVRGAISSGVFYGDEANHVYAGAALVEAHEYCESQDWIGLVLCPSAVDRLAEVGLPAEERLNYAIAEIPWKTSAAVPVAANQMKKLPACILGRWCLVNGENQVVRALKEMVEVSQGDSVRQKYKNAIAFIESNVRR